MRNK
jgi:hypothetical protein